MDHYQLNKDGNIYRLEFLIPNDIELWVEKYHRLIEMVFLQEMNIFERFSLIDKKYEAGDEKDNFKVHVKYSFTIGSNVEDLQVGHAVDQFMIFGNWLYYLDNNNNPWLNKIIVDETIRHIYTRWKLTDTSQIVSKVGQCHFRLKLDMVVDPLFSIFKYINYQHHSKNLNYGIKFEEVSTTEWIYDIHVWNEITHIRKLVEILSTKENVSNLNVRYGKQNWILVNNKTGENKMMTFQDSNDPNYVKDILLDAQEKERKESNQSDSFKSPDAILKEVLERLKWQNNMVSNFTIIVQYKDSKGELYAHQKQFNGKTLIDVAKDYNQELDEFTKFVKQPVANYLFEILIKNDYICEYFKYQTNHANSLISFIALKLLHIQNDKLIENNQLIYNMLK
jgi:hypothetical protein|nr:MAG TPA: hypothetical protein [Caudoviricetes sp.]